MNIKIYSIFILLLFQQIGWTQSVWPGDVNNNGVVNKVDLLHLGYAFGETGSARLIQGSDWDSYDLPMLWEGSFPNGMNFLYADCNGDGVVDIEDAEIIKKNLRLSHNDVNFIPDEILAGEQGENPSCKFMNPPSAVPVDQLFSLEIGLGDIDIPIDNISGFTFFVQARPQAIGINNTEFTFDADSWIESNEDISIKAQRKDLDKVRLEVAFTKTDRIPVGGFGSLGKVSFLIEEDIVDFFIIDSITFMIDSIIVLDNNLEPIPIVSDTLTIAIDKDLKVSTSPSLELASIEVYPNPNKGLLLIAAEAVSLSRVEVINAIGQKVYTQIPNNQSFQAINIQHLEKGFYWVKLYSNHGIKTEKIHKL